MKTILIYEDAYLCAVITTTYLMSFKEVRRFKNITNFIQAAQVLFLLKRQEGESVNFFYCGMYLKGKTIKEIKSQFNPVMVEIVAVLCH